MVEVWVGLLGASVSVNIRTERERERDLDGSALVCFQIGMEGF